MLEVACDGSALGNPGPSGWAWVIDDTRWSAGGWDDSTNNRAELQAVIEILKATAHTDHDLHILADSRYVINSVTKWMPVWRLKGWKKANGQDVLNRDLMEDMWAQVDALEKSGRTLKFTWVKGHANHALNELADKHARAYATALRDGTEPNPGPGLGGGEETGETTSATVNVWCPLEADVADQIAAAAKKRGTNPHDLLKELIYRGWKDYCDHGE